MTGAHETVDAGSAKLSSDVHNSSVVDDNEGWRAEVLVTRDFNLLSDPAAYRQVPDSWLIGIADIARSTEAIARGRYKAVNMVGAAVITALRNALGGTEIPFVFGGDGVSFLVAPKDRDAAQTVLAECMTWSSQAMALELRAGLVRVGDVRKESADTGQPRTVGLAWHQPSDHVRYAMFNGGGIVWAEHNIKQGRFAVHPAPSGALPDLSGLSCRWSPIPARRGAIVSLIMLPGLAAKADNFARAAEEIVGSFSALPGNGHPIPIDGPEFGFQAHGINLERRALYGTRRRAGDWLKLRSFYFIAWALLTFRLPMGGFDPMKYRRESGQNADFRKYEDGLKLTIDCDAALLEATKERLEALVQSGTIIYGISRQQSALMTCIVPSPNEADHIHFIDGAGGGYAAAASQLKARFVDGPT